MTLAPEDEIFFNLGVGETCLMCGEKAMNVKKLQEHYVKKHCAQSSQVLELLKMQQQIMNTILTNQTMHEQTMNKIAFTQTSVISDIKELKGTVVAGLGVSRPAPPVPAVPTARPPVAPRPAQPPATLSCPPPASLPASQPAQPPVAPQALSYADRLRRQAPGEPRADLVKNVAYITDSIGANVDIEKLAKLTKTKVKKVKAYAATKRSKSEGFKFPDSNFTDVVPATLAKEKFDIAFLLAPSVEMTNLAKNAHAEYANQEASCASYNIIKVAENALITNPELKKVIIAERVPRLDQWQELNTFANEELHEALKAVADEAIRKKIFIGAQTLDCQDHKGIQMSRYGDPRVCPRADGIHMRGSSGQISLTRSIASILAGAGLCDPSEAEQLGRSKPPSDSSSSSDRFETQRGRPAAPVRNAAQFAGVQTQNRFTVLGN